jgi:hypothetical protein
MPPTHQPRLTTLGACLAHVIQVLYGARCGVPTLSCSRDRARRRVCGAPSDEDATWEEIDFAAHVRWVGWGGEGGRTIRGEGVVCVGGGGYRWD